MSWLFGRRGSLITPTKRGKSKVLNPESTFSWYLVENACTSGYHQDCNSDHNIEDDIVLFAVWIESCSSFSHQPLAHSITNSYLGSGFNLICSSTMTVECRVSNRVLVACCFQAKTVRPGLSALQGDRLTSSSK